MLNFPVQPSQVNKCTYDPVWEAISRLELCGFKVLALKCDGLAANRRLFRMHNPEGGANNIVHKVPNPYAEDGRDLFFLADPPHLIKTVRNAWANSKRHLWVSRAIIYELDNNVH